MSTVLKSRSSPALNFRSPGTVAKKIVVPPGLLQRGTPWPLGGSRQHPRLPPPFFGGIARRHVLPHYHNRWVLIVPIKGSGTVIVDSGRHRLQPGVGLLVSPLRLHHYDSAPRRGLCWLFFTFELPPAPDLSPRRASPDSRRQRSALCPLLSHFGQTKGPRVSAARRSARWLLSCLSSWASLLTKIKT